MASGRELAQDFRDLKGDLKDNLDDSAEEGLELTQSRANRLLRFKDINYRGDIRRSSRIRKTDNGNGYVLKYGGPRAPHAPLVEMGTGIYFRSVDSEAQFGPYSAPSYLSEALVEAIDDWIDVKGIQAHSVPQTNLAWAIAHSIVEKGTQRQPFLMPAWRSTKPNIEHGARNAVRKSVRDM